MTNLDNIQFIKKLDAENLLGNLQEFPDQIEKCWSDWSKIAIPTHYIKCKSVLILGIGGSAIAGSLVSSISYPQLKVPLEVIRDYNIPAWVDKDTLIIAISYSGNTEETVNAFNQAAKITDKLIVISTGGKLASIGTRFKALHYRINYESQPRAALGYLFTSCLAIFSKLRLIEINNHDIKESIILVKGLIKKINIDVPQSRNEAKILANKIYNKIPVVYGSGYLSEVARRWKGQFNENSKSYSAFEILPELNHNALVGLEYPKDLSKKLFFIILESKFDHKRNKLRQNITTQILQQRRLNCDVLMISTALTPLSEMLQTIIFGDFVSYYLAILNNVSPNPVKIISYLKDKLAEQPIN